MLWRLNQELFPDPGNPIANTTVPRDAGGVATCGATTSEATPSLGSGNPASIAGLGSAVSVPGAGEALLAAIVGWSETLLPPRPRPPRRRRRRRTSPLRCGCSGVGLSWTGVVGAGSGSTTSRGWASGWVS